MKISNSIGFALGPILNALIGLITVPLTTWIFSPEDIGRQNVIITSLSFVLLFSSFGLDQTFVREYHEVGDKSNLLAVCAMPGYLVLLILSVIALMFSGLVETLLYGSDYRHLFWFVLVWAHINYWTRFLSMILRMQERGFAFSAAQISASFLKLAFMVLLFYSGFERSLRSLLWLSISAAMICMVVLVFVVRGDLRESFGRKPDFSCIRRYLMFGGGLTLNTIAYWGLVATNVYAIKCWSNLHELAIYSTAASFAGVAVLFQTVFSTIWSPLVYKWVSKGEDMSRIDAIAKQCASLVFSMVVLCGLFSWVVDLVLPPTYSDVKYVMVCSVFQPLLYILSEVTGIGVHIVRRSYSAFLVTGIALTANVVACYLLVPNWGARGAVVSSAIAFFVYFVGRTELSGLIWRNIERRGIYLLVITALVMAIVSACVGPNTSWHISIWWLMFSPFAFILTYKQWSALYLQVKPLVLRKDDDA